jgi:Tfp pilus assembly protein PilF
MNRRAEAGASDAADGPRSEGIVQRLESLLERGTDNALLRFGLGDAYLKAGDARRAVEHLAQAVRMDPRYSAAWKEYGKALTAAGRPDAAADAYRTGIDAARTNGDLQAAREMGVFLKRLQKSAG